jgi:hypothetical protein
MDRYTARRTSPDGCTCHRRSVRTLLLSALTIGLTLGSTTIASAHDTHRQDQRDLASLRRATTRYHDLDRAVADGYGILTDLAGVTCIGGPASEGDMGVHYVNGALVGDGRIDLARPEAVLFEPNGRFDDWNPRVRCPGPATGVRQW